jgi:preprotein translocase SecY subunit
LVQRKAQQTGEVNYFALLFKGDLPKRIAIVLVLLALCRVGYFIPLYGFDVDAAEEYFSRQAVSGSAGFIDQLFGGGLGRASLFSLGIGPYITASIVFQILTTVTPQLKSLAQGEEGEAGRDKYKGYIKNAAFALALIQGYGQMTQLQPFVFDNQGLWPLQITLQYALGAQIVLFIADTITEQKLGQGTSLLVFSSIVANLPRTFGAIVGKASESDQATLAGGIFAATLLVTILGVVYVLAAERRVPIVFAKRLQDEAAGQGGTSDAGDSYLPIKLNASGVLPLIFAGSLLSLPALAANYTRAPWLKPFAEALLPGSEYYIPLSMILIFIFSYISTFQVLDPKDMATNLRKQAAAIPSVRPGKETEEFIKGVLERASVFGGVILAVLFVLPNVIEALTQLSTPGSFGGTSLLILVGVAADTWRTLQAELLMQQYATDVDAFYKGKRDV